MTKRKAVMRPTAEEDAAIQRQISTDPDTLELTQEVMVGMAPSRFRGKQKKPVKQSVTVRLSPEVIAAYKKNSKTYGPVMEEALRAFAVEKGWINALPTERRPAKKTNLKNA